MAVLKMKWLNDNGTVVCGCCGAKFAPTETITDTNNICEKCAALQAEAELKNSAEADAVLNSAVK